MTHSKEEQQPACDKGHVGEVSDHSGRWQYCDGEKWVDIDQPPAGDRSVLPADEEPRSQ